MRYPVDMHMVYENNQEYRSSLRQWATTSLPEGWATKSLPEGWATKSLPEGWASDEVDQDVDEVTRDELDFDADAVSAFLDQVYQETSSDAQFQELYLLAAATMMSENPEIGLAVLCSYSYLIPFHTVICAWLTKKEHGAEMRELLGYLKRGTAGSP